MHWKYFVALARTKLCCLIARLGLSLCFGETNAFQNYIRRAQNPKFVKSSRQTTDRDLIRIYNDRAKQLINILNSFVLFIARTFSICWTTSVWLLL